METIIIHALPIEIFRMILAHLFEEDHKKYTIFLALHVCKLWRDELKVLINSNKSKLLSQSGSSLDSNMCNYFAWYGNVSGIKWAKNRKWLKHSYVTTITHTFAAENGHYEAIKYLLEKRCHPNPVDSIFCYAVKGGNIEIIKLLEKRGYGDKRDPRVCESAVRRNNFSTVTHLIEQKYFVSNIAVSLAARKGNLEMLKLLYSNCENIQQESICADAAYGGRLEVLKWLREKGFQWNYRTFSDAIVGGNIEVLNWLLKEKCPWNETDYLKYINNPMHTNE